MALTDIKCKNTKPTDKPQKLGDSGGLYLYVMPNGAKYWRMKYRIHGKEKLLALGVYPETTLSEARDKRDTARKLVAQGTDPSAQKKEEKHLAALNAENTFEPLAREWHSKNKAKWKEKHGQDIFVCRQNLLDRRVDKLRWYSVSRRVCMLMLSCSRLSVQQFS